MAVNKKDKRDKLFFHKSISGKEIETFRKEKKHLINYEILNII